MQNLSNLNENGFIIIENIYTKDEIKNIITCIDGIDSTKSTFRKGNDLFAIRQFLKEIPDSIQLIFNDNLNYIIKTIFGKDFFVVKSIYFDKPEDSNWFVSYHQDLTISVNNKVPLPNFGPWTIKQNQFGVQPPLEILQNIFTIRIHLDDTNTDNGALKVIPKSHLNGIFRPETINWNLEQEVFCNVLEGGIMIMKPLLLHGSNKTINNKKRRVIHIEFSNLDLPNELNWSEKMDIKQ